MREIKAPEAVVETSTSFDGQHVLEFKESSHRYKLDGKACVGVTTMGKGGYVTSIGLTNWMKTQTGEALFTALTVPGENGYYPREAFWPVSDERKRQLIKEASKKHEEVAQEAADIGTICHSYGELDSLGKHDEANQLLLYVQNLPQYDLIKSCIDKYRAWAETNKGKLVRAECLVASPVHLFCGKFDRLDGIDGRLIIRDYKTSKAIFVDQFIQMAGYIIAAKEWLNLDVQGMEVLRFGKEDGEFEHLLIDKPEEIEAFKAQAIRCRQTYAFRKIEQDKRFAWKGKNDASNI